MVSNFSHLSRMDGLRQKLNNQGLKDVVYMVINQQGAQAQLLHTVLASRLSEHITLHKQDGQQPDVWQKLSGEKDDFFIYDRLLPVEDTSFIYCRGNDKLMFLIFTHDACLSICDQVWPPHPPHFTSILHYRTRPRGASDQRHLLQPYLWRVHT